jgi:hypothetical protein
MQRQSRQRLREARGRRPGADHDAAGAAAPHPARAAAAAEQPRRRLCAPDRRAARRRACRAAPLCGGPRWRRRP